MDKKTIIIVVILGALLFFWFQIWEALGVYKPNQPQTQTQTQTDTIVPSDEIVTPTVDPSSEVAVGESEMVVNSDMAEVDTIGVDTIIVETNKYIITLSSLGGGPVSLKLKEYFYRDGRMIEMIPEAKRVTPEITFAGGTFSTSSVHFASSRMAGNYEATSALLELTYTYTNESGGAIKKYFTFYPDSYHYDLNVELVEPGKMGFATRYALNWNTPLLPTEPQLGADFDNFAAVAMMAGNREQLDDFEDNKLKQSLDGTSDWVGLRSKYFTAVMIPTNREGESVFANGEIDEVVTSTEDYNKRLVTAGIKMPFANVVSLTDSFTVFVGPMDYILMEDYEVGLEDMLDIGTTPIIGWLIKPFAIGIMWIMPKLYSMIPNYGFVIIIFALMVKILTLPLSMKSFKSMNAMKEIQPKVEALKAKLKKDPQKMNAEMMKLYKEHGVNPMSSCLPMLPQMPLFFAMFSVFRSTILLRDAPFIWFIDDLSRGATGFTDPYIVLVVLMIIAQFVSQKLTMSAGQQQKAFLYIMPLFMGFIFYKFAAGLVLYWACFSVLSLLDYFLFKRKAIKNPQVKTA